MALNNHDQAGIRDYLLGRLSDEEQEKIEERLMVDDALFEELEISKGELIEEYSAGELSQTEHEWFGRNYLASPEGKQRYLFAGALDCLESTKPASAPSPRPQPGFFDQFRAFFNVRPWALAGAAALVLLIGGATPFIYRVMQRPPLFASVDLTSDVYNRGPGARQYRKVALQPEIDELRITLKLPDSATARTSYVAELDNQTETTTFTPLEQNQKSVLVAIPTNKLQPGLYALSLYARLADGTLQREPWEYYFEITK